MKRNNRKYTLTKMRYTKIYDQIIVDESTVLINWTDFAEVGKDTLISLLKTMCQMSLSNKKIYVSTSKANRNLLSSIINELGLRDTTILTMHTKAFSTILCQAKYIYCNNQLPNYFIKKQNQELICFWLKAEKLEGETIPLQYVADSQRVMTMSNYLVFSSEDDFNYAKDLYHLQNTYYGEYLIRQGATQENTIPFYVETKIDDDSLKAISGKSLHNGLPTVLVYPGTLGEGKINDELFTRITNTDTSKHNFYLLCRPNIVRKNFYKIKENDVPFGVILRQGTKNMTLKERIAHYLYFTYNYEKPWINRAIDRVYCRDAKRTFGGLHIDYAIHYSGHDRHALNLFSKVECNKTVFIHDDLLKSERMLKNRHILSSYKAYQTFDRIQCGDNREIEGFDKIIENLAKKQIDVKSIQELGRDVLSFDDQTQSTHTVEQILSLVQSKTPILLNTGGFKKNRGLREFVDEFLEYKSDVVLIISGEYGENYELFKSLIEQHHCENMILIHSIKNPYPLMKLADAMVISSRRPGLPLRVLEAFSLQVPVIALKTAYGKGLLSYGFGTVVNNLETMIKLLVNHKVKPIDYNESWLVTRIYRLVVRKLKNRRKRMIRKLKRIVTKVMKTITPILSHVVPKKQKSILFISFHGRGYSDNPKALHEYMLQDTRFDDYEFIWAIKGKASRTTKIERSRIVRYASISYLWQLIRCKYWISNCKLPAYVYKTKKQKYLQTWHGTPLKRLAHDIIVPEGTTFYRSGMSFKEMGDTYTQDVKKYNYMISPSKFTTEVFQSAFQINKERLIETGYPRNDCLSNYKEEDVAGLKEQYGIPLDKKVVLYAPTWRDNSFNVAGYTFSLEVDFSKWQEVLGDEYVIIFKPHYLIVNSFNVDDYAGFVYSIDPTVDISKLYIISDILITDYSSVFFDYAILNRPIYFYMYDLESYASELRGFYIDIHKDLPGEIFEDEGKMVEVIKQDHYDYDQLGAFNQRFNNMEDGEASKRVLDIFFTE